MEPRATPRHDVYETAKEWKVLFLIVIPPGFCLAAWMMVYSLVGPEFSAGFRIACLLTGLSFTGFLGYAFLAIKKYKVEVFDDRIVETGAFRTRVISLSGLRGFKFLPAHNSLYAQFIPDDPAGKKQKIALPMSNANGFRQWLTGNLKNLDAEEFEQEMRTILANESLGINEEQRANTLARARKFAKALQVLSLFAMLWAVIMPRPYEAAVWTLVALPFVAVLSTRLHPGLFRLDGPQNGAFPSIGLALLTPPIALVARAVFDWDILAWRNFWIPFAVFSLLLFLTTAFHLPEVRRKAAEAASLLAICVLYGYATTICLNGIHDPSNPVSHKAKVLEKRVSTGRRTTYYLELSPWGPWKEPKEVDVSEWAFAKVAVSDSVNVLVKGGNFRIPWYFVRLE